MRVSDCIRGIDSDVVSLAAAREELLKKRRSQQRTRTVAHLLKLDVGMSWKKDFSSLVDEGDEERSLAAYRKLVKTVNTWFGESTPQVLHAAVYVVYHSLVAACISHEPAEIEEAEERLSSVFGPVKASDFATLSEAVQNIAETLSLPKRPTCAKWPSFYDEGLLKDSPFGNNLRVLPFLIPADQEDEDELVAGDDAAKPSSGNVPERAPAPNRNQKQNQSQLRIDGNVKILDRMWLRDECMTLAEGTGMSGADLTALVLSALMDANMTEAERQDTLINALGYDNVAMVATLIQKRDEIAAAEERGEREDEEILAAQENNANIVGRKARRRAAKAAAAAIANNGTDDLVIDADAWREARSEALRSGPNNELKPASASVRANDHAGKLVLPAGHIRIDVETHTEVYIPAPEQAPRASHEKIVSIEEAFDPWARPAFSGMPSLNRMQSQLYDSAFLSSENLLVAAPTGAGKTNVAMMCVLRELSFRVQNDEKTGRMRLSKDDLFKVVYVAPMKALAQEVVRTFGRRLGALGLGVVVKELTGDMQLTRRELEQTHMIVTTPEKWDVITRKSTDAALASLVKLLVIDEVHLLHEERGPVVEILIARTLRQVETSQSLIRIVGLSATLPNYMDVARFLRVNPKKGLHHFDGSFRPVPLEQRYIGVKGTGREAERVAMDAVCYQKVSDSLKAGNQVMIFVHSRKATARAAMAIVDAAKKAGELDLLFPPEKDGLKNQWQHALSREASSYKNKESRELFQYACGVHHAGMARPDRFMAEKHFSDGILRVLCCTATLAWGVNLPAHTVVIKGTQIYDADKGSFVELGMLDVQQIFGRAGRPQFDTSGEGIIITRISELDRYLRLVLRQTPIESQFANHLTDHLNAEVVLGTVASISEAVRWLAYTYLFVRMLVNPRAYAITHNQKLEDPLLEKRRADLAASSARTLAECGMLRFDASTGELQSTQLGRVASHYYLSYQTVQIFVDGLNKAGPNITDATVLALVCQASEFENVNLREDEMSELERLFLSSSTLPVPGGVTSKHGKCAVLFQAYLSRALLDASSLISDTHYVAKNGARLLRGMFEICRDRGWATASALCLDFCKMLDHRQWHFQTPLRQLMAGKRTALKADVLARIERDHLTLDEWAAMSPEEISARLRMPVGDHVTRAIGYIPFLAASEALVQPLTRTVLQVCVTVCADFTWVDNHHGAVQPWWVWLEDQAGAYLLACEYVMISKRDRHASRTLTFTIPIADDGVEAALPDYFTVRTVSDRFLGAETFLEIPIAGHVVLPSPPGPATELLALKPLPVSSALSADYAETLPWEHFPPVVTQVAHEMMYSTTNALISAPVSGERIVCAELAILQVIARDGSTGAPRDKILYVAPRSSTVNAQAKAWTRTFQSRLGQRVVRVTDDRDISYSAKFMKQARIICATPSAFARTQGQIGAGGSDQRIALVIVDSVHLLCDYEGNQVERLVTQFLRVGKDAGSENIADADSGDQGPDENVVELTQKEVKTVRIIGLGDSVDSHASLAAWLRVPRQSKFAFRPSVRPLPLEIHIQGHAGRHHAARMRAMNKSVFDALLAYSADAPAVVYVGSRRQARLTALDVIGHACRQDCGRQFARDGSEEAAQEAEDPHLAHTLSFGVGMRHSGLTSRDKDLVTRSFAMGALGLLICTPEVAWSEPLPARVVIVKGTERYDGAEGRYVDWPVTDILHMIATAGRVGLDSHGVAVVMVEESKKSFYKHFLYSPLPVESKLASVGADMLLDAIVDGSVTKRFEAVALLDGTYFAQRVRDNPTFYGCKSASDSDVKTFLKKQSNKWIAELIKENCAQDVKGVGLQPTRHGRASVHLGVSHFTIGSFLRIAGDKKCLSVDDGHHGALALISSAREMSVLPIRHGDEEVSNSLAKQFGLSRNQAHTICSWADSWCETSAASSSSSSGASCWISPHVKSLLLLHLLQTPSSSMPTADWSFDSHLVRRLSPPLCLALAKCLESTPFFETALAALHLHRTLTKTTKTTKTKAKKTASASSVSDNAASAVTFHITSDDSESNARTLHLRLTPNHPSGLYHLLLSSPTALLQTHLHTPLAVHSHRAIPLTGEEVAVEGVHESDAKGDFQVKFTVN